MNRFTINIFTALLMSAALVACAPAQFMSNQSAGANKEQGTGTVDPIPPVSPDKPAKDVFTQDNTANKVDILIVNDNSSSMDPEQQKMASRFGSFVSALKDIDYQIGMTTTDVDSAKWGLKGKLLDWTGTSSKVLSQQTNESASVFKNTIVRKETIGCRDRGECPSGDEQPLLATMMAMDLRSTGNAGFFRDGVDLVVVVLSDEDELSDAPAKATTAKDVVNRFEASFGKTKRLSVHGIVIKSGDAACLKEQVAQPGGGGHAGTRVESLAALTGGSISSICDSDYSKNLSSISQQVRQLIGTFELTQTPRPGSVVVTLTPKSTANYTVVGKKVIFANPPAAGTKIEIDYKY